MLTKFIPISYTKPNVRKTLKFGKLKSRFRLACPSTIHGRSGSFARAKVKIFA